MDRKRITIITGMGSALGTGHYQRMLNLALSLNLSDNFSAEIYLKRSEYPPDKQFGALFTYTVSIDSDLIIRDMRDSTREEIISLKNIAPVLVIDDSGEGRDHADYAVNMLPLPSDKPENIRQDRSLFIYGFNFAVGIDYLRKMEFAGKDIDVAVYTGYNPSEELVSSIKKSIPDGVKSVLMARGKASVLTGKLQLEGKEYAEIIARSKIIITHFGLTMYEGDACGCSIAALNPTSYHSSLTETVSGEFKIIFSSEYDRFKSEELCASIKHELDNYTERPVSLTESFKKIVAGTKNFIGYLESIFDKA